MEGYGEQGKDTGNYICASITIALEVKFEIGLNTNVELVFFCTGLQQAELTFCLLFLQEKGQQRQPLDNDIVWAKC